MWLTWFTSMPYFWSKLYNFFNFHPNKNIIWSKCAFFDPLQLLFKGQSLIHPFKTSFVPLGKLPIWAKTMPITLLSTLAIFSSIILLTPFLLHCVNIMEKIICSKFGSKFTKESKVMASWTLDLNMTYHAARCLAICLAHFSGHCLNFTSPQLSSQRSYGIDSFCILFYPMKWSFGLNKITKCTGGLSLA